MHKNGDWPVSSGSLALEALSSEGIVAFVPLNAMGILGLRVSTGEADWAGAEVLWVGSQLLKAVVDLFH